MSSSPSVAEIDAHLKECGSRLWDLARVLDEPFRDELVAITSVAFGHRSRDLFNGIGDCFDGSAPSAVETLLRSLVEANIALRFITQGDQALRLDLWAAEDARVRLTMSRELPHLPREILPAGEFVPPEVMVELEAQVAKARAAAVKRKVQAIRPNGGPVFPSIKDQVDALDEPAVRLAYTTAYRPLSGHAHVGAWAFNNAMVTRHGELISFKDPSGREHDRMIGVRSLALTTFASTLTVVSEVAGLGIGDEADAIKREFIPNERPLAERRT